MTGRSHVRTLALLLLAAGPAISCTPSDEEILTPRFVSTAWCPSDRVVVSRRTDLAVRVPVDALPKPPPPWTEPVPPEGVARDPERLAIWRKHERDPAFLEWSRADLESRPDLNPWVRRLREIRLYDVVGCGVRRLFACHDHSAHAHTSRHTSYEYVRRDCEELPGQRGASSEELHVAVQSVLGAGTLPYPVVLE
jgi:hypothetical protein